MKPLFFLAVLCLLCTNLSAQYTLSGRVQDGTGAPVAFANVAVYATADSSLVKVETTVDDGAFSVANLSAATYDLVISYVGAPTLRHNALVIQGDLNLGVLQLAPAGVDLDDVTVTATRALVEVKPDRTVFNVQGTINAAGNDALSLLAMAPGVTLDNSDNISVLSRSGVIIYINGRRLPLEGTDLTNYLRTLTAEQIDRIDIISSPGARYEAEGNAGIIDIRLKKAEDEGTNGTLTASASQGRYAIYALNAGGNYRNRSFNVFGNLGYASNDSYTRSLFDSRQNGLLLLDNQYSQPRLRTPSVRLGLDYYAGKRHTIGLLYSGQQQDVVRDVQNTTRIYPGSACSSGGMPEVPADSILVGGVDGQGGHDQHAFNLNYNFAIAAGHNLNVDLDYGLFRNDDLLDQPNRYVLPSGALLSTADASFNTPVDIDIAAGRIDYDFPLVGGTASTGAKYTRVQTDNTFLAYDGLFGEGQVLQLQQSNSFRYEETVYAGYVSYAGNFSERLSFSAGLRVEATRADSRLLALADLNDPPTRPIDSTYASLFPNAGLTFQLTENQVLSLRYGRRINRPNYNVLNPFRVQLNELSYEAGNPTLGPEIVNNLQLTYQLAQRYNFQLAYSRVQDAFARLLTPDPLDPRAGFSTYDNLAERSIYSFSASAPVELTSWWNVYFSGQASYVNNEANFSREFGVQGVVDVEQFNYGALLQQTFSLPGELTAELTARYISAGVSEGIFEYNDLGYVNVGLQRTFLGGKLNAKLSGNDIFRNFVIDGRSDFGGLVTNGTVFRDSRRVALSLSYNFGNQKVKSRRRDTGLDEAADRVE